MVAHGYVYRAPLSASLFFVCVLTSIQITVVRCLVHLFRKGAPKWCTGRGAVHREKHDTRTCCTVVRTPHAPAPGPPLFEVFPARCLLASLMRSRVVALFCLEKENENENENEKRLSNHLCF